MLVNCFAFRVAIVLFREIVNIVFFSPDAKNAFGYSTTANAEQPRKIISVKNMCNNTSITKIYQQC